MVHCSLKLKMKSIHYMKPPSLLKQVLILSLSMIVFPLGLSASAKSAMSLPSSALPVDSVIHMTADKQIYDMQKKKYFLDGRVTVNYHDIHIAGPRADIQMDPAGKPQVANFFNRPIFRRIKPTGGEDDVVGDIIRVYLMDDRYDAKGNVISHVTTVAADPFLIRSDVQEFDNKNKVVSASGNVQVDYKGSKASSSLANVRMKDDGKAERIIFVGGAHLKKENTDMHGDRITVMVDSGNLIAEHHVNTWVTLVANASGPAGAAAPATSSTASTQPAPHKTVASSTSTKTGPGSNKTGVLPKGNAASAKPSGNTAPAANDNDNPSQVFISSDYQEFDKATNQMLASGNVKILYGDYIATGPKATFQMTDTALDHIFLTGRATITQSGRTVTADKITITTNPKNFDALGNVKVNFETKDKSAAATPPPASNKGSGGQKSARSKLPVDDPSEY